VSANSPVGLITRDSIQLNRIEYRQACFRSVCFGNCCGVSSSRAERRRNPKQLFIESGDCQPLNAAAARPLGVYGLNRGFELKPPSAPVLESLSQMTLRFFY